jgi:opacity protein-like surface antigen
MQKKLVLALLLMTVFICGAFAQVNFSAGGGGLFDYSGRNGIKNEDGYSGFRNMSFGGFIFFDVTYAELDVNFAYGSLSYVTKDYESGEKTNSDNTSGTALQLGFSLLGKYPINLGSITIFPLVGVDYNIVFSAKTKVDKEETKDPNPGYSNQFGFLAGIGGDFNITKSVFIRAEGLFHIRLPSKGMKDGADLLNIFTGTDEYKATWGMGPRLKLGVGFRF